MSTRAAPPTVTRALFRALPTEEGDGDGTTRFVISSPVEARDGDVWAGPWRLDDYQANPVVLWSHDYRMPPIGRMVEIGEDDEGRLVGRVEWDTSDLNHLGQQAADQYHRGFLSAVSAGIRSGKITARKELPADHEHYSEADYSYLRTENTLLDVSAVTVPSDATALAQREAKALSEEGHLTADVGALVEGYLTSPAGQLTLEAHIRAAADEARTAELAAQTAWLDDDETPDDDWL